MREYNSGSICPALYRDESGNFMCKYANRQVDPIYGPCIGPEYTTCPVYIDYMKRREAEEKRSGEKPVEKEETSPLPPPIEIERRKNVGLIRIRGMSVDVRLPGVRIRNIGRVSLGRVIVNGYVGRSGYGYVYAGYLDGRRVAVKLPCDVSERRTFRRRDVEKFIREARIVKHLKHPNIVELLDYDDKPVPWIAYEFMRGGSLRTILNMVDRLPIRDCILIVVQLLDGLDYAHHFGIVHRDIKPENVLFTNNGVPKLSDFGIAKIMTAFSTSTDSFQGSLLYAAPEQFDRKRFGEVDWRTDI